MRSAKNKMVKKEYAWVEYVKQRVHEKNKNFLFIIVGPTGSGKSWASLSLGEMIDPDFNMEKVVFKAADVLNLVNSGTLKRGSFIDWDEAGIDLSNRDWQKKSNKVLNFLLQTWRHRGYILCLTVPYADFIDLSSRKLLHAEFETVSINIRNKTCRVKPKFLQYNSDMKKWFKPYLKVLRPGYGAIKLKRWDVPKPSDALIEKYEAKKLEFTSQLNKEIGMSLSGSVGDTSESLKPLTEYQTNILNLWKQGVFVGRVIARTLVSTTSKVSENIKWMRGKGCFKAYYEEIYKKSPKENGIMGVSPESAPGTS